MKDSSQGRFSVIRLSDCSHLSASNWWNVHFYPDKRSSPFSLFFPTFCVSHTILSGWVQPEWRGGLLVDMITFIHIKTLRSHTKNNLKWIFRFLLINAFLVYTVSVSYRCITAHASFVLRGNKANRILSLYVFEISVTEKKDWLISCEVICYFLFSIALPIHILVISLFNIIYNNFNISPSWLKKLK